MACRAEPSACCNGGDGSGVEPCAAVRSEAGGHVSDDHAAPQATFGSVVGGGDVTADGEQEEMVSALPDSLGQLATRVRRGRWFQDRAEAPLEIGAVLGLDGIREAVAALADGDGAQQMGQAELALPGVAVLSAITVGNPDLRRSALEEVRHELGGTAVGDNVVDGRGTMRHPASARASILAIAPSLRVTLSTSSISRANDPQLLHQFWRHDRGRSLHGLPVLGRGADFTGLSGDHLL